MNRRTRSIASALAVAATAVGLVAAPALAAPELDVTLERDEGAFPTVRHSDERVDFTVNVKNEAPSLGKPSEGDQLSCVTERGHWGFFLTHADYSFEFRWLGDGEPLTAWQAPNQVLGEDEISTYTVQAADAGHPIQCLVKGTNGAGTGSYVVASLPATVPDPQPAVAPPGPDSLAAFERRPQISGTASKDGEKLTCTAPSTEPGEGWSESHEESPITWSFEWLRDGESLGSGVENAAHTESEYELTAEDVSFPAAPAVFQCIATATNETPHSVVVESSSVPTSSPAPEFGPDRTAGETPRTGGLPAVENAGNTVSAPLTLELELPGGEKTRALETVPDSWDCEKLPVSGAQPAKVVCERRELLVPGDELPPLEVPTYLGAGTPDLVTARATVFGGGGAPVSAELTPPIEIQPALPFGLSGFTADLFDAAGEVDTQAGGHPHKGVSEIALNRKRAPSSPPTLPIGKVRQTIADLPPGVAGNQLALPELCPGVEVACPPGSAVGVIRTEFPVLPGNQTIYAIEPEFGAPAEFMFRDTFENIYTFSARLRPEDGYAVSLELAPAPKVNLLGATVTLCNYGLIGAAGEEVFCKEEGEAGANPKPLFTQPTSCGPLETRLLINSWSDPTFLESTDENEPITGCDKVPFEPTADLGPSSDDADSGTGFDVEVTMPTEGLEKGSECHEIQGDASSPLAPECLSESNLRKAEVTLPEGMAVNPSAGQGLGACSKSEIKLGTNEPISCPDSSKIGSVEIETPVIEDTLKGAVYIAEQGAVDGSLIGFYMVFDSPENGILVKLPAKVTPDPDTGQLVVTVEDSPQQPFSAVRMHFPGGDRATLLTPPECGTYEIEAKLTPWSGGAPVTQASRFEVDEGPNGGPCPDGSLTPGFRAGSLNPLAGATSPFTVHLTRPDGSQRFRALNLAMPPGLTAYLRGVPYCPDAVLTSILTAPGTAQGEVGNPSCPPASRIGTVIAGAGAGADPFFIDTGRAYLAGPYKGAPLSIAVVAPVVAGPLDLGNVVVRNALHVNSRNAQVSVVSDPIPSILHGLLTDIRDVRVLIDRPDFTLNPSGCKEKQVGATVHGLTGGIAQLANRFQVSGCRALGFKPRLKLRLFGGIRRGKYQGLRAVVRPRPGDSNIGRTVVRMPHSAFLAQEHIRTVCTRVQFAADRCPKGAIYGRAIAYSPLLDFPLRGNVYLRSSDNELPDLVADLRAPAHQPIRVELVGRTDSVRGALRNTFDVVPDAPVSYFRLQLFGKRKGLIVNSRNICRGKNRAGVRMDAHNGRRHITRPVLRNKRCGKLRRAKRSAHRSKLGRSAQPR